MLEHQSLLSNEEPELVQQDSRDCTLFELLDFIESLFHQVDLHQEVFDYLLVDLVHLVVVEKRLSYGLGAFQVDLLGNPSFVSIQNVQQNHDGFLLGKVPPLDSLQVFYQSHYLIVPFDSFTEVFVIVDDVELNPRTRVSSLLYLLLLVFLAIPPLFESWTLLKDFNTSGLALEQMGLVHYFLLVFRSRLSRVLRNGRVLAFLHDLKPKSKFFRVELFRLSLYDLLDRSRHWLVFEVFHRNQGQKNLVYREWFEKANLLGSLQQIRELDLDVLQVVVELEDLVDLLIDHGFVQVEGPPPLLLHLLDDGFLGDLLLHAR